MAERCLGETAQLAERGLALRFTVTDTHGLTRNAFALRFGGRVYAYLNECAHIPIELDFNPGDVLDISREYLVCSTHGAYYRPQTGECLGGPCPGRRLVALPVVEHDGQLWLQEGHYQ
ncbi:Rieske (2Fe-2S) protein [Chitinilyticum piscinae]|uniref:Rieske 2Fe-2S domain-containing protein n=1 Tax=Chitinilyticum piscinae TaxID=2866724 RepID=A0A8J7K1E3_9NEIS|nr:Rieske 2Fe-2S domain-containing protein [Chitinilyticum piscinae]MBE9608557.1 Rieske 2Fe-2S domain-containing protein [Chitinilyticum piscinae]